MKGKATAPSWLRVQQAADLLAVSATTVRRWADSGKLACRRTPSGQRRFVRGDLERELSIEAPAVVGSQPGDDAAQRYQLLFDTSLELASTLDLDDVLQSAARRLGAEDPRLRHLPARGQ